MESTLLQCRHMLQQARAMGQTPLVYIMNPATNRHLTDLAAIEVKPKQSTFQRWYMGVRKKKLILQVLFGVPILQNQHLNDGFVSLQLVPVPMQPQPAAPASPMPFVKREPVIQEAPALDAGCYMMGGGPDGLCSEAAHCPGCTATRERWKRKAEAAAPTLGDLAASTGMPTVTDILIKAVESADSLKSVVVLRVHNNNDVDICANIDTFAIAGVIQKAQVWLAMRGR